MADKTKIQWTEATWNPIIARRKDSDKRGWFCTKPSTGCKHCYAERMNFRLGTGLDYSVKSLDGIDIEIHEETLLKPLRWTRPRMIFVSSMSDLFHESVSFEMIDRVFAIMALCPQHTFMVLTKRPARMLEYIQAFNENRVRHLIYAGKGQRIPQLVWPLQNAWLGVTTENQETTDDRIPILLRIPAAVRWVSAEPLLEKIDLRLPSINDDMRKKTKNAGTWEIAQHIDWVVVGGESGRKDQDIRPMHPAWARSLRDQCVAAGVPFFFKQWGEWESVFAIHDYYDEDQKCEFKRGDFTGHERNGKKAAGRLLDGREWNQYPQ